MQSDESSESIYYSPSFHWINPWSCNRYVTHLWLLWYWTRRGGFPRLANWTFNQFFRPIESSNYRVNKLKIRRFVDVGKRVLPGSHVHQGICRLTPHRKILQQNFPTIRLQGKPENLRSPFFWSGRGLVCFERLVYMCWLRVFWKASVYVFATIIKTGKCSDLTVVHTSRRRGSTKHLTTTLSKI